MSMFKQLFSKAARQHQQALEMLEHIVYVPSHPGAPVDHDAGWEYLYLAAELARNIEALESTRLEFVNLSGAASGPAVADPIGELKHAMETMTTTVALTETVFSPAHMEGAFGPPGVAANEAAIAHVAGEVAGIYQNLIHVAMDVKSTNFGKYQALGNDVADLCLGPINQIRAFSTTLSENVQRVVDEVRGGKPQQTPLQLVLTLTVDDDAMQRLRKDMASFGASI